jgi:putative iron-regulated protein
LVNTAINGEAYDQMIFAGNSEGNATVEAAITALIEETKAIGVVSTVLGLILLGQQWTIIYLVALLPR